MHKSSIMVDQHQFRFYNVKPRVFVISDISNEPDDAESLVRFLLYANEFDIKGLVACTSTWMKSAVHPEDMETIIRAYKQVVTNLSAHVHPDNPYPSAEHLLGLIRSGPSVYGKRALESGVPLSGGAALLIDQLSASSDEPLWVLCWGGTNVLAQALHHIHQSQSASDSARLRSRLRVYSISDQDDTGLWIRITYPDVFYICSIHGWNQYAMATWVGISGDIIHKFDEDGPDITKVTASWLKKHIQIGPLGGVYPDYKFIMEGDTPTFLYLIQNGLGAPEHPEWGSWGGRYNLVDLGGAARHYSDATDSVIGKDGKVYTSNKATIWRWRDAYQNDFAARIQWTLSADPSSANHAPVVIVNDSHGPEPLLIFIEAGEEVVLDASKSYDSDGDKLTFSWFQYKEPTAGSTGLVDAQIPNLDISHVGDAHGPGNKVKFTLPPPEKCAIDLLSGQAQSKGQVFHVIVEVKDDGYPCLCSYKRVVIQVTNRQLRGGRDRAVETVTEWLQFQ
jgi:hypothetical protein